MRINLYFGALFVLGTLQSYAQAPNTGNQTDKTQIIYCEPQKVDHPGSVVNSFTLTYFPSKGVYRAEAVLKDGTAVSSPFDLGCLIAEGLPKSPIGICRYLAIQNEKYGKKLVSIENETTTILNEITKLSESSTLVVISLRDFIDSNRNFVPREQSQLTFAAAECTFSPAP